jgi:serine/threonine protein kinase/DNA-binding beta-propeller fold protein YncE
MAISQNFGKYRVICEVGRGGMGIVYKAHDPGLNRTVAIKQLILEHVAPDKKVEFRERFRREACLIAGLSHPNLVSIFDVSMSENNSYYVMEFLNGVSLRTVINQSPGKKMSVQDFLPIFKQTCEGLSHAHGMALVHRDIKPDNIVILPDGKVKITDFGIARSTRSSDRSILTRPGTMLGTLSYVSPEQLKDASNVDQQADIYSLAVVAYEALCGQVPFAGDMTSTLMAIASREPTPANEVNPEISLEIAAVIARAMRKNAADRYPSVAEFEKEFLRAMGLSRPGGSSSGGMPRMGSTGGGTGSSYTPGIPVVNSGRFTPPAGIRAPTTGAGSATPASGDIPKTQTTKPWFSVKTSELNVLSAGEHQPIAQPVAPVKVIGQIGRPGDGPGSFLEPAAICVRGGKIVVADTSRRDFQVFGRDGRLLGESRPGPSGKQAAKTGGGVFSKPSAVAIDSRGRIYAADSSDHYIRIFDGQGTFQRELLNKQGKDGGILGLLCDSAGNLYLSDPGNGCVQVMSIEKGTWTRKVGSKGVGEGKMQLPQGIALDRSGQLFVVDYGTSKISVFSKAGFFQRCWGGKGTGKGEFNVPRGIAVDNTGRVYVGDSLNHRVQVFSNEGDYMYSFGGRGSEAGRFIGPSDLSIDPDNNRLYVADRGNCRVQVFELLTG